MFYKDGMATFDKFVHLIIIQRCSTIVAMILCQNKIRYYCGGVCHMEPPLIRVGFGQNLMGDKYVCFGLASCGFFTNALWPFLLVQLGVVWSN